MGLNVYFKTNHIVYSHNPMCPAGHIGLWEIPLGDRLNGIFPGTMTNYIIWLNFSIPTYPISLLG